MAHASLALAVLTVVSAQVIDDSALLQLDQASKADSCECMNWKEVYGAGHVQCKKSQGYEYEKLKKLGWFLPTSFIHRMDAKAHNMPGRCLNFLPKFDDNFCINKECETANVTQWCYVSSECRQLNGGKKINKKVNAKICSPSEGLQDRSVENYKALSEKFHLKYEGPQAGTTEPEYMFMAKMTMAPDEFTKFYGDNCDPVRDAPFCVKKADSEVLHLKEELRKANKEIGELKREIAELKQ